MIAYPKAVQSVVASSQWHFDGVVHEGGVFWHVVCLGWFRKRETLIHGNIVQNTACQISLGYRSVCPAVSRHL